MPTPHQRMEALERENVRLKNELLAANEQVAQLKILIEKHTLQIRELREKRLSKGC